jgi:hypothetical protein
MILLQQQTATPTTVTYTRNAEESLIFRVIKSIHVQSAMFSVQGMFIQIKCLVIKGNLADPTGNCGAFGRDD